MEQKNTREDKFRVELKISSSIANGFVVDINHNELHSALPHELKNKSHFNNSEG